MSDRTHLRAYGLLVFTTWCWGLNTIFSRLAVGEISPMQLVMFRWLGVIAILLVFTRKHLVRDWPILRQHLLFLTIIGSLGFTLFNYLFYLAGHHTALLILEFYKVRFRYLFYFVAGWFCERVSLQCRLLVF